MKVERDEIWQLAVEAPDLLRCPRTQEVLRHTLNETLRRNAFTAVDSVQLT